MLQGKYWLYVNQRHIWGLEWGLNVMLSLLYDIRIFSMICLICSNVCGTGQNFKELEYFLLAMISAVPSFLIPLIFVGKVISFTRLFFV